MHTPLQSFVHYLGLFMVTFVITTAYCILQRSTTYPGSDHKYYTVFNKMSILMLHIHTPIWWMNDSIVHYTCIILKKYSFKVIADSIHAPVFCRDGLKGDPKQIICRMHMRILERNTEMLFYCIEEC